MQYKQKQRELYALSLLNYRDEALQTALYVLKSTIAFCKTSEFKAMSMKERDKYLLMMFDLRYFLEEIYEVTKVNTAEKKDLHT